MTGLQPPLIGITNAGQIITNGWVQANWTNGLTFALNPPIASLYQSVSQSFTNNTAVSVTFDSEYYDTYSGHSTTSNTSRYTSQAPGYYSLVGSASIATNTTGFRQLAWYVNGAIAGSKVQVAPSPSFETVIQVTSEVYLNLGDYAELRVWQNSGSALASQVADASVQPSALIHWLHE